MVAKGRKRKRINSEDSEESEMSGVLKKKSTKKSKKKKKGKKKKKDKKKKKKQISDDDYSEDVVVADVEDDESESDWAPKSASKPLKKRKISAVESPGDNESESEGSFHPDDGYDSDFLGDEEDRRILAEKTEIEREEILAQRAEERTRKRNAWEARRQLRRHEKRGSPARRRETRVRETVTAEKTSKTRALDDLRNKRDKTKKARARSEEFSSSRGDDKDLEYVAEEEERDARDAFHDDAPMRDTGVHNDYSYKEEPQLDEENKPGDMKALNAIRLKRTVLENWVYQPFFEEACTGAFVRMSDGGKVSQGHVSYRIFEVIGVKETDNVYMLGKTKTKKRLIMRHGAKEITSSMEYVSNGDFQLPEYEELAAACKRAKMKLLTRGEAKKKREQLNSFKESFTLTSADIDKMVEAKKSVGLVKNATLAKAELNIQQLKYQEEGNQAAVLETRKQIHQLAELAREQKKDSRQMSLIDKVNERNMAANRADMLAIKRKGGNAGRTGLDPFARIWSQSVNMWDIKAAPEVEKAREEQRKREAELKKQQEEEEEKRKQEEAERRAREEEEKRVAPADALAKAHDIDLDIDLDLDDLDGPEISFGSTALPEFLAKPTKVTEDIRNLPKKHRPTKHKPTKHVPSGSRKPKRP